MLKRLLIPLGMVILLMLSLAGCTGETELRKVELNEVTRSVFYAPLYAAVTRGFFEEEGMQINITTGGGSDKSMTALLAKEADVALMGPETAVYVHNEGKADHPLIVAQLTKRDGSFLLGRNADEAFSWENLRGKSVIAGRPGGMPYMTLLYVLEKNGLVPNEDVEVISNIQFPLMGGAFDSGTGDYVTLFEPTASLFADAQKGHIVANIGLESGEIPYTVFMVRPETIEKEPEFVQAFVRAVYKAQCWIWNATDAEIAEAMLPFFPDSDLDTLSKVAKSYRETDSWTKDPVMTEDAFSRLQDVMENAGELSSRVPLAELVNNDFAHVCMKDK